MRGCQESIAPHNRGDLAGECAGFSYIAKCAIKHKGGCAGLSANSLDCWENSWVGTTPSEQIRVPHQIVADGCQWGSMFLNYLREEVMGDNEGIYCFRSLCGSSSRVMLSAHHMSKECGLPGAALSQSPVANLSYQYRAWSFPCIIPIVECCLAYSC